MNKTAAKRQKSPGQQFRDFLKDTVDIPPVVLAEGIGIPARTMKAILNDQEPITADIAVRLAAFYRTTPELWLSFQVGNVTDPEWQHKLEQAEKDIGKPELRRIRDFGKELQKIYTELGFVDNGDLPVKSRKSSDHKSNHEQLTRSRISGNRGAT
jgi:addiction module HigA family antidote